MLFEVYTFDKNGNIIFVESSGGYIFYTYDSANQLIREDNENINKTFVWTYDEAGNILSRHEYPYTYVMDDPTSPTKIVLYGYGDNDWGDLLTSYNGRNFSYDGIGNLTNDGVWTYTWKHGRELASMTKGSTTWTYTYNADGLRIRRNNGSTTYTYVYNDGLLTQVTLDAGTYSVPMYITYDANGLPFTIDYNGVVYYYVLNAFGDVIGLANTAGVLVVEYIYDAWGNQVYCTGSFWNTLGKHNPLRYRSYIYDEETGLYYLQSRYYNPEIGRFINADGQISGVGGDMLGYNMFTYCFNNPVNMSDPTGRFPWALVVLGVFVVAGGVLGYMYDGKLGAQTTEQKQSKNQSSTPLQQNNEPNMNNKSSNEDILQERKYELTTGDRIKNTAIGMGLGLAVGGLTVASAGAIACIAGSGAVVVPLFGLTGKQTVASGMLAYNAFVMFVAPFFGMELEPIEIVP